MAANSITVFGLECFVAGWMGSMTSEREFAALRRYKSEVVLCWRFYSLIKGRWSCEELWHVDGQQKTIPPVGMIPWPILQIVGGCTQTSCLQRHLFP